MDKKEMDDKWMNEKERWVNDGWITEKHIENKKKDRWIKRKIVE